MRFSGRIGTLDVIVIVDPTVHVSLFAVRGGCPGYLAYTVEMIGTEHVEEHMALDREVSWKRGVRYILIEVEVNLGRMCREFRVLWKKPNTPQGPPSLPLGDPRDAEMGPKGR